jgi:Family of unknown function (DUF6232)
MATVVYFENERVKITNTRAIFDATTYSLRTISSVEAHEIEPSRVIPLLVGLVGLLGTFLALVTHWLSFVFGLLLLITSASLYWIEEHEYAVIIGASGDVCKAYFSSDEAEIDAIVAALEEAIDDMG